jgi:hypothetical protein
MTQYQFKTAFDESPRRKPSGGFRLFFNGLIMLDLLKQRKG